MIVPGSTGDPGDTNTSYYLVRKVAAVTGRDLRNARPSLDENNQPAVSFTLNNEGGRKFGQVTGDNIGRQRAIILDGRVPDEGAAVELGIAYAHKELAMPEKRLVGLMTDVRASFISAKLNPMLAVPLE